MLATFVYISLVSRLTNGVWLAVVFQVGLCSFLFFFAPSLYCCKVVRSRVFSLGV